MSVDTVNSALTTVRLRFERNPEMFSAEGQRRLLVICGCMRDYLMQDGAKGFNRYVDSLLMRDPDAADFVLEELFAELGFAGGVREQLSAALAE
jgi:hypothetical protein